MYDETDGEVCAWMWGSLDGQCRRSCSISRAVSGLSSKGRRSGAFTGSWKESILEGRLPREELWLLSGITTGPRAPHNKEARKQIP